MTREEMFYHWLDEKYPDVKLTELQKEIISLVGNASAADRPIQLVKLLNEAHLDSYTGLQ
jgi:hypothetical protein